MKSKISIILVYCLFVFTALSQAEVLSLDSCIEHAKQHNCTIQSANLNVAISQEVKKQMLWKYFPQVNLNGMAYGAINPLVDIDILDASKNGLGEILKDILDFIKSVDPNVNISSELKLLRWGVSAQAQAVQPIYWGGKIVTANKLAKLGIDASKLQAEVSERDVLQEVTETYWLVSGLQQKRHSVDKARTLLDSVDMVVNTAFNHGLVTRNDILKVQLKRNEIETKAMQLENGIHIASRMLCHLVGMDYTEELQLDTLREISGVETLMLMPDSFSIEGRPETQLLEMNLKYEKLMKRLSLGDALPKVLLGIQGGYSNLFERNNFNGLAFMTVTIPLTQWGETSHKLREHNLRIQQAEMMKGNLREKLSLQNEQVYDQMTEAIRLMEQHKAGVELASDNYSNSLMNYQAGITTITDLLEAEALLLQAENAYTDSQITFLNSQRKYNDFNK